MLSIRRLRPVAGLFSLGTYPRLSEGFLTPFFSFLSCSSAAVARSEVQRGSATAATALHQRCISLSSLLTLQIAYTVYYKRGVIRRYDNCSVCMSAKYE